MSVAIAFVGVVLIWSLTPLGIVWSSQSIPPEFSVLARMAIALVLGTLILVIWRIKLPCHRQALTLYGYSTLGVFGGMQLSYYAAQTLPSGLISLMFGFSPILAGLLSQKILKEAAFTPAKKLAFLASLLGFGVIATDVLQSRIDLSLGLLFIALAVVVFSVSMVMLKTVQVNIHPIASTVGTLGFSVPLFTLTWLISGAEVNFPEWQTKATVTLVLLGIFASLLGFVAYFHIVKHLKPEQVALPTLVTPVFAIFIGNQVNNEPVSSSLVIGAALVITGLAIYQFGEKLKRILVPKDTGQRSKVH